MEESPLCAIQQGPWEEEAAQEEAHQLADVVAWMECKSKKCRILDLGRRVPEQTSRHLSEWLMRYSCY